MTNALEKLPKVERLDFVPYAYEEKDKSEYTITHTDGVYYVTGPYVDYLASKAYLDDVDSFNWFQRMMRERGIIDDLRSRGAKDGDTICVVDVEFELID